MGNVNPGKSSGDSISIGSSLEKGIRKVAKVMIRKMALNQESVPFVTHFAKKKYPSDASTQLKTHTASRLIQEKTLVKSTIKA